MKTKNKANSHSVRPAKGEVVLHGLDGWAAFAFQPIAVVGQLTRPVEAASCIPYIQHHQPK